VCQKKLGISQMKGPKKVEGSSHKGNEAKSLTEEGVKDKEIMEEKLGKRRGLGLRTGVGEP